MSKEQGSASRTGVIVTFVVRKLWTVFAIALVLVALFMSLLRYSLPFLNNHKDYVQNYISNRYSIDIEIGELSASWQNQGPTMVMRDVSIKNGSQSPLSLVIGEVFLEVEFWPSIAARKLQSNNVMLNQLDLAVDLTRIEKGDADFPIVNALENIFLEQLSNFVVSNSSITLISVENAKAIDIANISWLNKDNRHQGVGEFVLEDFSDNNASFVIDLYGNVDSYSGTLFAQAQDLNLSAWINEFTGLDSQLVSSKGNVKVWARVENRDIKRIDGKVLPTSFEWATEHATVKNTIEASFAAVKGPQQWDFAIADLLLSTEDNTIITDVTGNFSKEDGAVFRISKPLSLKPLFSLSSLLSVNLADNLALVNADAQLSELTGLINNEGLTLDATFGNIAWQEHNEISGIEALQAKLFWQGKRGRLLVSGQDTELSANYYFSRNLALTELDVPIDFDFTTDAKISVGQALAKIDGLHLEFDTEYGLTNNFLSLSVGIQPFGIAKVPTLLPKHLVGVDTNKFLKNAFTSTGKVESANLVFHGELNKFPFEDRSGVFQSNVSVEDAEFSFSQGWPSLTNLDIDLFFENNGLAMQSKSSLLDKVALTNLQANIPDLSANALLTITADGAATSRDITDLMLKSSLADSLGQLLDKDVIVDGQLSTNLRLLIPLNDGTQTRAKGNVFLDGNTLSIPAISLELSDTDGMLSFDNELIDVENLTAKLLDQPIKVKLSGEQLAEKYSLVTQLSGNWDTSKLAQIVNDDLAALFVGASNWTVDVALDLMADNFSYIAELNSDLLGTSADLPVPLAKPASETLALNIKSRGDRVASSVDLSLADIVRFEGALAHKEKQFNRAHLALGPTELETRGLGFSISADFDTLIVEQWIPFISAISKDADKSKTTLLGMPKRIFIDTEKLSIAGQSFSDVDMIVKRLDDQWTFDVDANELRGNISLFDEWFSKGVVIDAEYIRIAKADTQEQKDTHKTEFEKIDIDPKTLPNINFTCKACDIRGINLGRVELEAEPNNDGLRITQLLINNEFGNLSASGQWYKRNQDHYTFVGGDLNSKSFGEFIKQLGFDSGIKDSSADLSFALTWKDSPLDIQFENLDGEIDWELSDGYLTEVSDQGSRLFTLLSLNSLVRKLSLDFRDVFAKGFFYDEMKGSIQITQGKADTRDTRIDGAAGEIEIYGYTDLANKELNYNVSFAPNVTGNLPILVYFFTVSPPSALAALAIDQVLTSTKVISNINYSVTGTIEEPILIETGRESTDVDLPARRESLPSDNLPPFIPPTEDDLIQIEVKDGQSD
jgi:uncharacterized protein (TIGR02099 family)